MKTPILFIIFNKIFETKEVFKVIKSQKPEFLFIAADGPRPDRIGEDIKCKEIKNWVIENIDWECKLMTLFRDTNVGCGKGPSEAISWFFDHVEEGIILEDDCLPNSSFFSFTEELLTKYRDNKQISIISGNNFQIIQPILSEFDYYFSVFPSSNGWATWKRSWIDFEYDLTDWSSMNKDDKQEILNFISEEKKYSLWWRRQFDWIVKNKPSDMWDFQFHFNCMKKKQFAIIPSANLVSNIGYGPDATHSSDPNSMFANVPTFEFKFPLIHPTYIKRNYTADLYIQKNLFGEVEIISNWKKIKRFIKKIIKYIKYNK